MESKFQRLGELLDLSDPAEVDIMSTLVDSFITKFQQVLESHRRSKLDSPVSPDPDQGRFYESEVEAPASPAASDVSDFIQPKRAKRVRQVSESSSEISLGENPFSPLDNGEEDMEVSEPPQPSLATVMAEQREERRKRSQNQHGAKRSHTSKDVKTEGSPATSTPGTKEDSASSSSSTPSRRIPAITIHKKEDWLKISAAFAVNKINFTKAVSHFDGIHVSPATADDHRRLSKWLEVNKISHHVYKLPQDKPLRVVIRGLPHGFPCQEIKSELLGMGFPILEISKIKIGGSQKRDSHLVYVLLTKCKEAEAIYDLTTLHHLKVIVEAKRRPDGRIRQCFNCQLYGHTASSCRAPAVCNLCASSHSTKECTRGEDDPLACINCKRAGKIGHHASSDRQCPYLPKTLAKAPPKSPPKDAPKKSQKRDSRKFSEAVRGEKAENSKAASGKAPGRRETDCGCKQGSQNQESGKNPDYRCNPVSPLENADVWAAFQGFLKNLMSAGSPAEAVKLLTGPKQSAKQHGCTK